MSKFKDQFRLIYFDTDGKYYRWWYDGPYRYVDVMRAKWYKNPKVVLRTERFYTPADLEYAQREGKSLVLVS